MRTSNWKIYLQKPRSQFGSKKFFIIKKVQNTLPWTYLVDDLHGEGIVGTFYKKSYNKYIKKNLG